MNNSAAIILKSIGLAIIALGVIISVPNYLSGILPWIIVISIFLGSVSVGMIIFGLGELINQLQSLNDRFVVGCYDSQNAHRKAYDNNADGREVGSANQHVHDKEDHSLQNSKKSFDFSDSIDKDSKYSFIKTKWKLASVYKKRIYNTLIAKGAEIDMIVSSPFENYCVVRIRPNKYKAVQIIQNGVFDPYLLELTEVPMLRKWIQENFG